MSEERLKEIKDSIDLQHDLLTIKGDSLELINEEIELYNEVVRLLEENRRLKQACKGDYEASQEIMGEMKEEINKLSHLVANKVIVDYDYDSVLKRELNEERRKNIVLTESKNMTENVLNKFEKWLEDKLKDSYANNDVARGYKNALKICFYKLQELKGSNK